MTTQTVNESPLVDIAKPTMTSPVSGLVYRSPLTVSGVAGIGPGPGTAEYEAAFYEPYQLVKNTVPSDKRISFNHNAAPGPKRLDIRTGYRIGNDQSWSDWQSIGWFYVLTPPRTDTA